MKRPLSNCTSSQKSPKTACLSMCNRIGTWYPSMFMDDLCRHFSIEFGDRSSDFYTVRPQDNRLKSLLSFEESFFLEYGMDRLLSVSMNTLFCVGKAYLEIVEIKDREGNIKGVSFAPITPILAIQCRKKTYFLSVLKNKAMKMYSIENRNIIVFHLKKLGYSRGFLNGIFRKLKKLDALEIVSMNVTSKVTGFDFGEFVRKNDFRLLKETRKIYWYGRKGDNQFMSESYLLYRNARFKMLKKAALKYMLEQINKGLKKHSEEWKISGEIVAQFKDIDYMKKFDDFQEKRITPSEFCDIIFGRLERL